MNRLKTILAASAAFAALSAPGLATAQAADQGAALGEIIVTARKASENLQDVPVSISVVTGATLQNAGVTRLENLSAQVPNFIFSEAVANNDQVAIRGVASGVNSGFENSVGQVINGMFFGRSRFGRAAFLDVGQVEVLKGPQGPLIGKNTTAGAINIVTAAPTSTFQGYAIANGEVEGDRGFGLEGAVSGPLSDRLKARAAIRYEDFDGYYHNSSTGKREMGRKDLTFRLMADYKLSDALTASLMYQHGDQDRTGRNRELSTCSAAELAVLSTVGEDCKVNLRNSALNLQNGVEIPTATDTKFDIAGLTLNADVGSLGRLTSITGYGQYHARDQWDGDVTRIEATSFDVTEDYEQWSQEVRLASASKGSVDYLVGGYFLWTTQGQQFSIDFRQNGPAPLFPVLPAANRARNNRFSTQDSHTEAAFGQLVWRFAPQWSLTAGARYTHESKDARSHEFPTALFSLTPVPLPPGGPASTAHDVSGSLSEDQLSPSLNLQWRPSQEAMLYAKVDRGFKSGGFDQQLSGNQIVANRFQFKPEKVTAYELGGKLRLLDGRMTLNGSLFRSEFKDLQVSSLVPDSLAVVFQVGNAASAISQGVEADLRWRPVQSLVITGAIAYLDATYDDYSKAPCYTGQNAATGCVGGLQNLSGKRLMLAPKWKGSTTAEYTWGLGGGLEMVAFGQLEFSSRYSLTTPLDPNGFQDGYAKIDARLTLQQPAKGWQVSVIGRNLTDKLTSNFGNTSLTNAFFRFIEPPREVLLQVRADF